MPAMHSLVDSSHQPLWVRIHTPEEDKETQRGPVTGHSRQLLGPTRISDLSPKPAPFSLKTLVFSRQSCVHLGRFCIPNSAWWMEHGTIGGPWKYFLSRKYGHKHQGIVGLQGLETCRSSKGILSKDCNSHFSEEETQAQGGERDISEATNPIWGPEGIPVRC